MNFTLPNDLGGLAALLWAWAVDFLPRIIGSAVIVIAGFWLAGWAGRAVWRMSRRTVGLDETLQPVISAAVRYGIIIIVFVLFEPLGLY